MFGRNQILVQNYKLIQKNLINNIEISFIFCSLKIQTIKNN